jgi:phosphatidylglycerophosphate synthase
MSIPLDQRLARRLVTPLRRTPVTPNQITALSLGLALAAGALFSTGGAQAAAWAAGLFALGRFLDHADGELARLQGRASRFGYYFDYAVGALSSAALFVGIGIGFQHGALGQWSVAVGWAAAVCALIAMALGVGVDSRHGGQAGGYPARWGFELEDGIYLVAPITWLGGLDWFFILAASGQMLFCLWMLARYLRAEPAPAAAGP